MSYRNKSIESTLWLMIRDSIVLNRSLTASGTRTFDSPSPYNESELHFKEGKQKSFDIFR